MRSIVLLAERLGADEAEIFHASDRAVSVSSERDEVRTKEYSLSDGYGVRVIKDGRIGFSYFAKGGDAEAAIKRAVSLSKFSRKAPFGLPHSSRFPKVDVFDKRIDRLDEEEAVGMLQEILASISAPSKPTKTGIDYGTANFEIENSSGLSASGSSTHISCFAHCAIGKSGGSSDRSSAHLDFEPSKVGDEASERAREMVRAKPAKGGRMPAVLEPEALYSLLFSLLLPSFHGERVHRKISKLHDKVGGKVASEALTISDDPLCDAPGSSPFDGEGTASRKKILLKKGVVSDFLFDSKTAVLVPGPGVSPGNCRRFSYLSEPGIGPSNLVLESGKATDALEECGNGILVCSVFGEHTANDLTGEFSVSVDRGFEIVGGRKGKPTRGNVISGNMFSLIEGITAIEKKKERYGNLITPRIAFEEIQVVG